MIRNSENGSNVSQEMTSNATPIVANSSRCRVVGHVNVANGHSGVRPELVDAIDALPEATAMTATQHLHSC